MYTSEELVSMFDARWNVSLSPHQIKYQIAYTDTLVKEYDSELIAYCISHADRYIGKGKTIYSMKYLPYIIEPAKKDYEKSKLIPDVIAQSKIKRETELKELEIKPEAKNIKFKSNRPALKEITEDEIKHLYDDYM